MSESVVDQQAGQAGSASAAAPTAYARVNWAYQAIIGVAMGIVALFTALAWIPAILTGLIIGRSQVERSKGISVGGATQALRILAVTGGVLAMLFLGAVIGGLIAFFIVALVSFSERILSDTSATDHTMARIFTTIVALVVWFVALYVVGFNFKVNIGG